MQFSFLVASVHQTKSVITIDYDGEPAQVEISEVEVQLTDETNRHGSQTLRFRTAEEKAYALGKYVQGEMIDMEI